MEKELEKMKEKLTWLLATEFVTLEGLAKIHHQRKDDLKNAPLQETVAASNAVDASMNSMALEESYLRGIICLARVLDLITPQEANIFLDKINAFWRKSDDHE